MVSARPLSDAWPLSLGAALFVDTLLSFADGDALPLLEGVLLPRVEGDSLPLPPQGELEAVVTVVSSALREGLRESEGVALCDSEAIGDLLGRVLRVAVFMPLPCAVALLLPTTLAEGQGLIDEVTAAERLANVALSAPLAVVVRVAAEALSSCDADGVAVA